MTRINAFISQSESRVPGLDGIRGVAILTVFISHALNGIFPHGRPLFAEQRFFQSGGILGVQLFFVLSGYLITGVLLREFYNTESISIRAFYVRRFFRIVPVLALLCAVFSLVGYSTGLEGTSGSLLRALTFTSNLPFVFPAISDNHWLGHTWSVAAEEQFYLVWPVVLWQGLAWHRRFLPLILITGITAINITRFQVAATMDTWIVGWDASLVGALTALQPFQFPRWVGAGGAALYLMLLFWNPTDSAASAFLLLAGVSSALMVPTAFWSRLLSSAPLRYFGRISYELYLWHVFIMRFPIPATVSIPISIALADISHRAIGLPCIQTGRRLSARIAQANRRQQFSGFFAPYTREGKRGSEISPND